MAYLTPSGYELTAVDGKVRALYGSDGDHTSTGLVSCSVILGVILRPIESSLRHSAQHGAVHDYSVSRSLLQSGY